MSLATISIVGNLAKEPELFNLSNGQRKTTLVLAVNSFKTERNKREKRTDYYKVETWDRLADLANTYLQKGNQVTVSGKFAMEKWVDREGNSRITPTVQANQLAFPPRLRSFESEPNRRSEVISRDASAGTVLDAVPLEAGMVQDEVQTAPRPAVENSESHSEEPGNFDEREEENADGASNHDEPDDDDGSESVLAALDGTVVSVPPDDEPTVLSGANASAVRKSA
jgi:single-strand DNA-binding protein